MPRGGQNSLALQRDIWLTTCLAWDADSCWEWPWQKRNGYGQLAKQQAHRVLYERLREPIPTGMQLDHLCRNRACVNPWHLEIVTQRENCRRAALAVHATCKNGHPLNDTDERGYRRCRPCTLERKRRMDRHLRAIGRKK